MTDTSESRKARKESWVMPAVFGLVVAVALIGGWWAFTHMKDGGGPRRQVAKIALLPDTPPPPPPKEEKKPEPPKEEPKHVVREEQVKQAEAPKAPAEQMKMNGAAGEGNSAFAAGNVTHDATSGQIGGSGTGGIGTGSDRAAERFFANTVRQQLRDEIERRLKGGADQIVASFSIWLARDGAIERYELQPSGNEGDDTALRAALDETVRQFKLPPPPAIAQPMRFRLNVRPQA